MDGAAGTGRKKLLQEARCSVVHGRVRLGGALVMRGVTVSLQNINKCDMSATIKCNHINSTSGELQNSCETVGVAMDPAKFNSEVRHLFSHPCPGNRVAMDHAVVYYARAS